MWCLLTEKVLSFLQSAQEFLSLALFLSLAFLQPVRPGQLKKKKTCLGLTKPMAREAFSRDRARRSAKEKRTKSFSCGEAVQPERFCEDRNRQKVEAGERQKAGEERGH